MFDLTEADILRAIDAAPLHDFGPNEWSGVAYVIDPRDQRPWDLKPILRLSAKLAGKSLYEGFTSTRYREDVLGLGFSLILFDKDTGRAFGVRGFDPSHFEDAHVVVLPDGRKIENGAAANAALFSKVDPSERAAPKGWAYEAQVATTHRRLERRSQAGKYLKAQSKLICAGCGFDAEARYGRDIAHSLIDAHHLQPFKDIPPEGRWVCAVDFALLCATCHRLIHRLPSPDDLDGLRRMVAE